MRSSFYYPFYRSPHAFGYGYPAYGYGYPYPAYGYGNNIIGSAIGTNSVINTGSITGVTQTTTPTVIW